MKRLSVIIPAYNEERNLEEVVKKVYLIAPKYCSDFEIIIVNDGSTDRTDKVLKKLSKKYKKIIVLCNEVNMGMGYSYFKGLDNAHFEYSMIVFGDNDHPIESMARILSNMGKSDMVIAYYKNLHLTKTWLRHVISISYTHIINKITGFKIAYYNGMTLHRTDLLMKVPRFTQGFGYQAETIVYLLKQGASYTEVDIFNENRKSGATAAFKLKNIVAVFISFLRLLWLYKIRPSK